MNCKLLVNGKSFRVYPRHADNKVTQGQRDEPADISKIVEAGKNCIEISCQDPNEYAYAIQLVTPRSREDVMKFMHPPEKTESAILRVRRIVRSKDHCGLASLSTGLGVGQVVDDADDEVQTTTSMMSLKCPFSSKRIRTPARLLNIDALECVFDLDAFISMAQKTRKWACPHSLRQSSVHHLAQDVWLEAVLQSLQNLPSVMEVEVSKEGMWKLKGETKWRNIYNTTPIDSIPSSVQDGGEEDEESEDEAEELRQAALAAKQAFRDHYQRADPSKELEVVNLLSSDEDGEMHPDAALFPVPNGKFLSASNPPWTRALLLVGIVNPNRIHGMGSVPPGSRADYDQRANMASSVASAMAEFSFLQPEERMHSLHPVLPGPARPPPLASHGYRAVHPTNYAAPSFYQANYTVAPVQLQARDSPIVVKTGPINVPAPVGMPRLNKRSREMIENRVHPRRMDRMHRRLPQQSVTHDWSISQMECIEINIDSDRE